MDTVVLIEGKGGFPTLKIDNEYATALITLYGAQVLSYKPKLENSGTDNARDILFLSDKAYYEQGKAIKGGIPICWPWFGNDPENSGRPAHGFARNTLWSLEKNAATDEGETQITLSLSDLRRHKNSGHTHSNSRCWLLLEKHCVCPCKPAILASRRLP